MGNGPPASRAQILALKKEYSTPYSALTHDDVVMGVSRYFLERWLPTLGPSPAALVNTLRQLDYRCQGEAITISGTELAREAHMSRRHLYKCFETPWLDAFIRVDSGEKQRAQDGTLVQQANSYRVRMDDPLTAADADRLHDILRNLSDDPIGAVNKALALDPRQLWAAEPTAPGIHFTEPRAITAREVIQRAFPTWNAPDSATAERFGQLAEDLHRHVVLTRDDGRTSKVIVSQYFRRRWWAHLGHDLAWVYLWLRGTVYDNPAEGITRDTCWVPALDSVLTLIGRPREWWRRNVEKASHDNWKLSDFFEQIDSQKGRDPNHPQWVARQFRVALQVPIAPEDQPAYREMLAQWSLPKTEEPPSSATNMHTGSAEVPHIHTHRPPQSPPQMYTPVEPSSATNVHTGTEGVRHIHAQASATDMHTIEESVKQQVPPALHSEPVNSKHQPSAHNEPGKPGEKPAAVAETTSTEKLVDRLAQTLQQAPQTPLFACAPCDLWLAQVWPEPIPPHTPIWRRAKSGAISQQDLIALVLAVWGDTSINQPPRYLSWLVQRWDALPDSDPVVDWDTWRELSALPIGEWFVEGRRRWIELVPPERRELPFGLDLLAPEQVSEVGRDSVSTPVKVPDSAPDSVPETSPDATDDTGLDEHPNGGALTIRDIWSATLGQLRLQLNPSTYANWIEGAQPLSYANGILTVQARHRTACDWLTDRLNHTVEGTASSLAGGPIAIRYTAPDRTKRFITSD